MLVLPSFAAGIVQTALYADFIYYFIKSNQNERIIKLPIWSVIFLITLLSLIASTACTLPTLSLHRKLPPIVLPLLLVSSTRTPVANPALLARLFQTLFCILHLLVSALIVHLITKDSFVLFQLMLARLSEIFICYRFAQSNQFVSSRQRFDWSFLKSGHNPHSNFSTTNCHFYDSSLILNESWDQAYLQAIPQTNWVRTL